METRSNHLLIGFLILFLGFFVANFFVWMKNNAKSGVQAYKIEFEGAVTGLSQASDVLYNGVKVGKVKSIDLDLKQHARVIVVVNITKSLVLRANARAQIAQQALTGYSSIQIIPGSKDASVIAANDGVLPLIPADSTTQRPLSDAAPAILAQAELLLQRFNRLIVHNEGDIRSSVKNVNSFTQTLSDKRPQVAEILDNVASLTKRFDAVALKFDAIATKLDGSAGALNQLLDKDGVSLVNEAKQAVQSISSLAQKLEQGFGGDSGNVVKLAKQNLNEFQRFIQDGQRAVRSLDRVLSQVEQNPQGLLFGNNKQPEYQSSQ